MNENTWPQCRIKDCTNPAKSAAGRPRPLCSKHQKDRETEANSQKPCEAEGCDNHRHQARRYCSGHVRRLYSLGELLPDLPLPGAPTGTGPCGYVAAHERVRKAKGSVKDYTCISCPNQALHWAYKHGSPNEQTAVILKDGRSWKASWSGDPNDYEPMCRTCHARFDRDHRNSLAEAHIVRGEQ